MLPIIFSSVRSLKKNSERAKHVRYKPCPGENFNIYSNEFDQEGLIREISLGYFNNEDSAKECIKRIRNGNINGAKRMTRNKKWGYLREL